MFNFIGKSFVLLYGAGAFFCLMLATAVFTQRIDYGVPKEAETGKKALTLVARNQEIIKELMQTNQRAQTDHVNQMPILIDTEMNLAQRRDYYSAYLEMVRTGKFLNNEIAKPIQEIAFDDNGLLKLANPADPSQKAIFVLTNEVARPAYIYLAEIKTTDASLAKIQADIKMLLADYAKSTQIINGSEVPDMLVKGLRTYIKEQIKIRKDADAEREWLEDHITNRRAEAQLTIKRKNALLARLEELKRLLGRSNTPGGQGNSQN